MLGTWDQSWRQATHKSKNACFSTEVIANFLEYVYVKIPLLLVDYFCICNINETNIFLHRERSTRSQKRVKNSVSEVSQYESEVYYHAGWKFGRRETSIFQGINKLTGHIRREINAKGGYKMGYKQKRGWMNC